MTSLLLLAGCQSTATVTMMEPAQAPSASGSSTTSSAEADADPGEPTAPPADTSDAPATPVPADDPTSRFVLRGELPLESEEVNELIAFVEQTTGRPFLRPPVIVAQTPEGFIEGLQDDLSDFQADAEVSVRTLQALGLTDRGVAEVADAFAALLLSPEGILGYYDPVPDELYVPVGAQGDDDFRSLLVHELVHALDGQYVDLTVLDDLVEIAEETGDYEPVGALQAVAEGRASSVQNQWMDANGVAQELPEDLGAIANVPPALVLGLSVPYAFGEIFIEGNGGPAATWDLLEDPPDSSEAFMVPGAGADEPIIDVPTPAADGPVLDEAVYGASDLFVWLLGESLEPDPSLLFPTFSAIDGWAGGRSVLWGDDVESCIRIAFAADSEADLVEIQQAITLWADADSMRTVQRRDDLVVATGCAPYVS